MTWSLSAPAWLTLKRKYSCKPPASPLPRARCPIVALPHASPKKGGRLCATFAGPPPRQPHACRAPHGATDLGRPRRELADRGGLLAHRLVTPSRRAITRPVGTPPRASKLQRPAGLVRQWERRRRTRSMTLLGHPRRASRGSQWARRRIFQSQAGRRAARTPVAARALRPADLGPCRGRRSRTKWRWPALLAPREGRAARAG